HSSFSWALKFLQVFQLWTAAEALGPRGFSMVHDPRSMIHEGRKWTMSHGSFENKKIKAPKIRRLFGRRKGDPSPSVEACTLFCPAWRPCPPTTPGRQRRCFGDRTRGTARTHVSQQPNYRSAAFESQS